MCQKYYNCIIHTKASICLPLQAKMKSCGLSNKYPPHLDVISVKDLIFAVLRFVQSNRFSVCPDKQKIQQEQAMQWE